MAISLIDALSITEDDSKQFHVKFVTFNKSKKTGGQIIELNDCKRVGADYNLSKQDMISVAQPHGHPYPIHTHLILEVNHQQVFL
jgi:hypothetical protein